MRLRKMKFEVWVWSLMRKFEHIWNWRMIETWRWNLKLKSEFEVWSGSLNIFEAEENKWLGVWWWEMRTVKYYKIQKTKDDKSENQIQ